MFLCGKVIFLPMTRFTQRYDQNTKLMFLPHFKMTLPPQKMTLPHFGWQGHFFVWQGHFKVWQGHLFSPEQEQN